MPYPNPVRCFWVEETDFATGCCWGLGQGNNCLVDRWGRTVTSKTEERDRLCCKSKTQYLDHGPKPWPAPDLTNLAVKAQMVPVCERCSRVIPGCEWYSGSDTLYRLPAVRTWIESFGAGTMIPMDLMPPGAMWDSRWLAGDRGEDRGFTGPDGISLTVRLPCGQHWNVDSQCSNCSRDQYVPVEGDDRARRFVRTHYCWNRSGDPRAGQLHVDKDSDPQKTCAAGAGSIWVDQGGPRDWHGFAHDNFLKLC